MADDHYHVFPNLEDWQYDISDHEDNARLKDTASDNTKDLYVEEDEIALKHPVQDSIVKITDEGYIDLFADPGLGIRIDPITKSVNIVGDVVNIFSKTLNVKTKPNDFVWNGYYFNPELYYENSTERNQRIQGVKEYYHQYPHDKPTGERWHEDPWAIKPMIQYNNRNKYTTGMVDMLKNLGLPVE